MAATPIMRWWDGSTLNPALLNYPGPALDLATQTIHQFATLLGFPTGIHWQDIMVGMLKSGVLQQGTQDQQDWLFGQLPGQYQQSMPWARYGMDKDTYNQTLEKVGLAWTDIVGEGPPSEVLNLAIRNKWSSAQLEDYAKTHASEATPWVSAGDKFSAIKESYISTYGQAPSSRDSLASWYNFRQSAKKVGPNQEAKTVEPGQQRQQSGAASDSEVR